MTVTHELKCQQPWFQAVWDGYKPFEVRRNDRNFQPGDHVMLKECWLDDQGEVQYTGRTAGREITYVLRDGEQFGIAPDVVVLGLDQRDVVPGS